MAKDREDGPVDLTKSKFSIDFLLDTSNERGQPFRGGGAYDAGHHTASRSRSVSPDLERDDEDDDHEEDHRTDDCSPSTSRLDRHHDERRKRPRTAFTGTQIKTLEAEFEKNKYLSVVKRIELSKALGLSQQQLKVWYQNRRTKWKRKYANDLETMAQQYYNSMGLAGSRPMLIGDRLWIFNSPHDMASPLRRGLVVGSPEMPGTTGPSSMLSPSGSLLPPPPMQSRTGSPFHPFNPFAGIPRPSVVGGTTSPFSTHIKIGSQRDSPSL
ncbi:putative Homeobox protein B-H2 [Hypsibius exemplaris]|uniref:Homeobox protein B-H2 n=1 Tax=Hypsibius exemplaris TaxID=2072580 RepID=A0A1W0X7T8_HYPEX|nr:putative Homeobox protein B-H2 [Hypsibius exemplaris]